MEFINLQRQYIIRKKQIDSAVLNTLENADYIMGKAVAGFEKNLAIKIGRQYAVTCGSGTDALQLIFMAYGIGKGDAVFCPDMTFIASIEPLCLLGGTPVFCDIELDTFNIMPESLERQIEKVIAKGSLRPKAIVAVDFLGNPADYSKLEAIAKKYGLLLIEDAAQGLGGLYNGKMCGALGDISATSFFPTKPLGAYGDGGAVFTDEAGINELLTSLRVHGKGKTKYDNIHIGMNSRLDTIQAGILDVKLSYLDEENLIRQKIAQIYTEELNNIITVQKICENMVSAYAQYVILLPEYADRENFMNYMKREGIPCIIYYPNPLHLLPVFKNTDTYGENLDNSIAYSRRNVGIPFSPYLSEEEQTKVIRAVNKYFR